MTLRERAVAVARLFEIEYPDVKCGLEAGDNAYRLLMMAILSAQCTDKRVNIISVPLFEKYDEFVPPELIKKGFAYGILDIRGMKERILGWDKEFNL